MRHVLHLTGASGAGVSTLGAALGACLGRPVFETDAFYWQPTDPPFRSAVAMPERLHRLESALNETAPNKTVPNKMAGAVLAGSLAGWGDPLIPRFEAVVFVLTDTALRLQRLARRESQRHGARIEPGGDMAGAHLDFLAWAERYEQGPMADRSRLRHETWLAALPCPVVRVDGAEPIEALVQRVLAELRLEGRRPG